MADTAMRAAADAAAASLAALLGCRRLLVATPDGDGFETAAATGVAAPDRIPRAEFVAADRCLRDGEPLVTSAGLPSWMAEAWSLLPAPDARNPMALLACSGGSSGSAPFLREAAAAAPLGALLAGCHVSRQAASDAEAIASTTRMITAAILEGRTLGDIAAIAAEAVAEHLDVTRVGVFARNPDSTFEPVALRGVSPAYAHTVARTASRSPIVARAQATGLPYHAQDLQNDERYNEAMQALFRSENITSVLIAVIQHHDRLLGAMTVYPEPDRRFRPHELALFGAVADKMALAIALEQQMGEQRDEAALAERERLRREMHDTVAQSLSALGMEIDTARRHLAAGRADSAREVLDGARRRAAEALQETRRAVNALPPIALERHDLATALRESVAEFQSRTGVSAEFVISGEPAPHVSDVDGAVIRIANESLANAAAHASARRVRVGLVYSADSVELVVEDDGKGFDRASMPPVGPEGGYGLFGMEQRAAALGGTLTVESTPGWGTRVRARLPLAPRSSLGAPARTADAPRDGPAPIGVLIVDDQAMIRQSLRALLEDTADMRVVGEAASGAEAAEQARSLQPDVILMDLQMDGTDGVSALERIRASRPSQAAVVLTASPDGLQRALAAGALGYVTKDADSSEVVAAVRAAHRGEAFVAREVSARLAALAANEAALGIGPRERDVLRHLARGLPNKAIAKELGISVATVEYHLTGLYARLGVSNRTEAVAEATRRGLVAG